MTGEKKEHGLFDEENPAPVTDIRSDRDESAALTMFKAVIGAILGSVPSMILWIVLGKAGYAAAICGFFMMLGELYACDFITRKSRQMNTEAALLVCVIVMAAAAYLCERVIWSWELADLLYSEGVTFSDCFLNFGSITDDLDIKYDFLASLIKSCVFAAIGAAAACIKLFKK